jgi:imidazoleglycerol-phosphate dehydratase/histidinol-phosphatase
MKKVLFIDRDGTLIEEPDDFQVDSFTKLRFLPGVFTYLGKIAREMDFELVMVTNQDGLGTESFPESDFTPVQEFIVSSLKAEGIEFSRVHVDCSLPHENKPTRKPGIGMLGEYFSDGYDLSGSFVIGDRETDVQLAENLGCQAIFLDTGRFEAPTSEGLRSVRSWEEIYGLLRFPNRTAVRSRKTSETEIHIELNLDGTGTSEISTGIHFFDHMLEQISRHGGIDMKIVAKGDLHVDEHHTIEDVAIALGETFSDALGDKRGIERYGFCLPMDDCLAQVAIDFGGRNWCVWEADFKRETIGQMPTEMFFHFFKSFSDKAQCNLNIKAEGSIEHHKIEAIFKAFAKAIKMAIKRDLGNASVPSTKGVI